MTVLDPMPKDKRTRAYKDWLKREQQRERMKELAGAVSLRGFTYQDADANEKYASLSMMLAELRYKLITDNSTAIEISEGRLDTSGYTRNALTIHPNSKYVTDFKNWVFQNQFNDSGYYQQYPYLSDFQMKLLEEGKTIPKTNQYGQPTRPERNLGIAGTQCSWKVIGDNHYTRQPIVRYSRTQEIEGGDERSNRWQPIIPDNLTGTSFGLFPPTFWPRDLGEIPQTDDEIMMAMIDWLDNLIEIYWSTPQYGTTPRVGIAWRDEHRRKYYHGNPAYEGTELSTLEEIRGNEEARAWLEDASLGILLSFLRNMTIANTFYQEVYDDVLSVDAEWVVLQNPAMSSTDEYNAPRGPNLVMPFTTWIDKAMAHKDWRNCAYVTYNRGASAPERVEVTREMLLEQGLSLYESDELPYHFGAGYKKGPSRVNSLGLLTLAMNETVSFQNLIDPNIFQEALSAYTEIWRDSQKERVARLKNENETKMEETTAWLKKTRQELADAEVKSYVQFTQQTGPRGGIYDGRAVQFVMQLKPNVDWRAAPPRYTEAQEQDYLNLQREVYQKFVEAVIPQSPEDVTFIDITRKIPYSEAVKIKGETRSYGSKYKYPALERAMSGRSISEQFMQTQETTLTALLSKFRGMSKEDKAGLMRIVPTTVKDIRSDRALKQSVKQMTSQLGKVAQAQRALDRTQATFDNLAKTVTKKQRKALQEAYLASVKRGSRKSGEPTVELLKALGIPVPKED
mgnify:CR=1 FL=1|tara:strand:- start:9581 stop:11794 length:2214 start_codon:yes stop_codon:yes gene_type:complete